MGLNDRFRPSLAHGAGLFLAAAAGCLDGAGGARETGATVLAVTSVPSGVLCLRFAVQPAGAAAVTLDRGVVGGEVSVDLGALSGGAVTLSAQAFTVACAAVTPTTSPGWIAGPLATTIRAGYVNDVDLVFRPNTQVIVRGDFVVPVRAISTAQATTYALLQDGTVRAWGYNAYGQLGNGTLTGSPRPVTVSGLTGVAQVVGGSVHACALREGGTAWCWGFNGRGHIGDGTSGIALTPRQVSTGATRFTEIGVGSEHACGLSGTQLWCWGAYTSFVGSVDALVPVAVPSPGGLAAHGVAIGGYGTCARVASSRLSCAGKNTYGELALAPIPVTAFAENLYGIAGAADVGERHSCAVTLAGGVRCAGRYDYGQLGNGAVSADYFESTPVTASITGVAAVTVGLFHTCALKTDGTVWCWGRGDRGQIGTIAAAGTLRVTAAQQVTGLTEVTQISAGGDYTCALRRDGTVWCWGFNEHGQLGDGSLLTRYVPVRVAL